MAVLGAVIGRVLRDPAARPGAPASDHLGTAKLLVNQGDLGKAKACLEAAVAGGCDDGSPALLRLLGRLHRQAGDLDAATRTWERWRREGPAFDAHPYEELAKLLEHRRKDLPAALGDRRGRDRPLPARRRRDARASSTAPRASAPAVRRVGPSGDGRARPGRAGPDDPTRRAPDDPPDDAPAAPRDHVDAWLRKRRIAVCGATPKRDRWGYRVFRRLLDEGYDVIPVHPIAPARRPDPVLREPVRDPRRRRRRERDHAAVGVDRSCCATPPRSDGRRAGSSPGASSDEALAEAARLGIPTIDGPCVLIELDRTRRPPGTSGAEGCEVPRARRPAASGYLSPAARRARSARRRSSRSAGTATGRSVAMPPAIRSMATSTATRESDGHGGGLEARGARLRDGGAGALADGREPRHVLRQRLLAGLQVVDLGVERTHLELERGEAGVEVGRLALRAGGDGGDGGDDQDHGEQGEGVRAHGGLRMGTWRYEADREASPPPGVHGTRGARRGKVAGRRPPACPSPPPPPPRPAAQAPDPRPEARRSRRPARGPSDSGQSMDARGNARMLPSVPPEMPVSSPLARPSRWLAPLAVAGALAWLTTVGFGGGGRTSIEESVRTRWGSPVEGEGIERELRGYLERYGARSRARGGSRSRRWPAWAGPRPPWTSRRGCPGSPRSPAPSSDSRRSCSTPSAGTGPTPRQATWLYGRIVLARIEAGDPRAPDGARADGVADLLERDHPALHARDEDAGRRGHEGARPRRSRAGRTSTSSGPPARSSSRGPTTSRTCRSSWSCSGPAGARTAAPRGSRSCARSA